MEDLFVINDWVENVFCPTGPGGGIDPTCSPKGSGHAASAASVRKHFPLSEDDLERTVSFNNDGADEAGWDPLGEDEAKFQAAVQKTGGTYAGAWSHPINSPGEYRIAVTAPSGADLKEFSAAVRRTLANDMGVELSRGKQLSKDRPALDELYSSLPGTGSPTRGDRRAKKVNDMFAVTVDPMMGSSGKIVPIGLLPGSTQGELRSDGPTTTTTNQGNSE